ncbi:hypothetical protein E2C01_049567 [Portunus trituberculatus]|uniref:Uncharacterized protein n=1 Tax=Portunus trituberculatus TaxID=210409 RepID=A0A5B7GGE2_PORTR|nr:hypothetical protein [Portunus trituberculatus]
MKTVLCIRNVSLSQCRFGLALLMYESSPPLHESSPPFAREFSFARDFSPFVREFSPLFLIYNPISNEETFTVLPYHLASAIKMRYVLVKSEKRHKIDKIRSGFETRNRTIATSPLRQSRAMRVGACTC